MLVPKCYVVRETAALPDVRVLVPAAEAPAALTFSPVLQCALQKIILTSPTWLCSYKRRDGFVFDLSERPRTASISASLATCMSATDMLRAGARTA